MEWSLLISDYCNKASSTEISHATSIQDNKIEQRTVRVTYEHHNRLASSITDIVTKNESTNQRCKCGENKTIETNVIAFKSALHNGQSNHYQCKKAAIFDHYC